MPRTGTSTGGRLRDGALLAREPLRARRQLLDVGEDLGELEVVERLLLEQLEGEPVEDVAVGVDHLVGLVVRLLDEGAHLDVDALGDALAEVAAMAHVAAHEDLARGLSRA